MNKNVKTLDDFLKRVIFLSEKKKDTQQVFFRGESKDHGDSRCQPGIFREKNWIKNEHLFVKETIVNNPDLFVNDKLMIDKLTKMQHYGLPTRLLDLTSNSLLALYMSLSETGEDLKKNDSIVYVFSVEKTKIKFYDSDTVSVIANLSKREKFDFPKVYENRIEEFNNLKDIKYLTHNIKDEKPYFKSEIIPEHLHSIFCVIPLMNNRRIISQQGLFLLFGNDKENKFKPAKFSECGIELDKITIDRNSKQKIKKHLEITGISTPSVYPDIDKIAEYLKEKYQT